MNLSLAFAFACHFECFFGLADAVRKLMHGQTLIHSCGDLMIPKRLKLLMKVLRRLQRLLRMPSTLSETPSLFFLCPAQITQAAAAEAAATGNQHKISAFHCCSCCCCCFCFFFGSFCRVHNLAALSCQHILCASETGCGCCQIIKTPTLAMRQVAPPLALAVAGYHSFAHSNRELSVGPTFNGVTQQLVVVATMLQVPRSLCFLLGLGRAIDCHKNFTFLPC